jgi:hypothetical protein
VTATVPPMTKRMAMEGAQMQHAEELFKGLQKVMLSYESGALLSIVMDVQSTEKWTQLRSQTQGFFYKMAGELRSRG